MSATALNERTRMLFEDDYYGDLADQDEPPAQWQQHVTLQATGKYVPTQDYVAERNDEEHWAIRGADGEVATVDPDTDDVHVTRDVTSLSLFNEAHAYAELVGLSIDEALQAYVRTLIDEARRRAELDRATETALVWRPAGDVGTGQWWIEEHLDARNQSDLREVRYARTDAAEYWLDGQAHPFPESGLNLERRSTEHPRTEGNHRRE